MFIVIIQKYSLFLNIDLSPVTLLNLLISSSSFLVASQTCFFKQVYVKIQLWSWKWELFIFCLIPVGTWFKSDRDFCKPYNDHKIFTTLSGLLLWLHPLRIKWIIMSIVCTLLEIVTSPKLTNRYFQNLLD